MLYRIFTENKNYDATMKLTLAYFPKGFTVHKTEGYWEKGHEHSIVIEVAYNNAQHVYDLAWDIMKDNEQKTVLVVAIPCETKFVR